tara:strand:- start:1093 stop:1614 length:522 start_codon:yes stop_codon:yes gene_type:complete
MEGSIQHIEINHTSKKTQLIEQIKHYHLNGSSIYILPTDEKSINLAFFVADVFRRSGNFINCVYESNFPQKMAVYICNYKNTSIEKQITRETTLETLKQHKIPFDVSILTLRACGVSCSTMFKYSIYLVESGVWEYISTININAIPVKINAKNIFKTTVQVKLQKVFYGDNSI